MKYKAPKKDVQLIKALGGTRALAQRLNYSEQRVQNWLNRKTGIPAQVRLDHPEIFLRELQAATEPKPVAEPWDGVTERRAEPRAHAGA